VAPCIYVTCIYVLAPMAGIYVYICLCIQGLRQRDRRAPNSIFFPDFFYWGVMMGAQRVCGMCGIPIVDYTDKKWGLRASRTGI
jgi:hypothetical protein